MHKRSLAVTLLTLALPTAALAQPSTPPTPEPTPPTEPTGDTPVASEPAMPAPMPEPPPPTEPKKDEKPAVKVSYDKGVVFESDDGDFELKLALRTQFRLELERPLEDGSELTGRFVIPRGRLQLEGHVHGEDTRYKLEAALDDRGSYSFVKDMYIEHKFGELWARVGQWKRPFNRQEIVSDFGSELNERAITAEFVGGGRDVGVAISNDYEKSPEGLEWVVGVFDRFSGGSDRPGLGTTCTQNAMTMAITCTSATPTNAPADFGPTLVGRVGWNQGKIKGYSEADLEGGPLRFAVGASYKVDLADLSKGTETSTSKNLSHGAQVDALIKVEGLDVMVAGYLMKLKSADARIGFLLQAGYFLTPKKVQVAGRFALHQTTGDRKLLEARAAFNYYIAGHAWKIATDAGMLVETGEDPVTMESDKPDLQGRVMAQLTF